MKLFMIIYILGEVGMWAGPLPYDESECMERADLLSMAFVKKYEDGVRQKFDGVEITPEDTLIACEFRAEKPVTGVEIN